MSRDGSLHAAAVGTTVDASDAVAAPWNNGRDPKVPIQPSTPQSGRAATGSITLLQDALAFERLLLDLSATFVNIPLQEIDQQIEAGLQRLGRFLGIDRSSFAQFTPDRRDMVVKHCYVAPGIPPFPQVIVDGQLPWYAAQIRRGEVVRFSDLPEDLPAEAHLEADYCRQAGIRSNLAIPLRVGGALFCAITFATFHRRCEWSDDVVERLRLIGEIFATSLARRREEERAQQLREQLMRAGRVNLLGALTASIAHEINQPLCAIVTNAHAAHRMLRQDHPDLDEVRETCQDIAADSQRASEIILRIRGMLQRARPAPTPLSVNDAIGEAMTLLRDQLVKRNVELAMDLQADLPQVLGDRVQVQQVILNLVVNALDAMNDTEAASRRLALATALNERAVIVTVNDSGPGISPEELDRVFDPFVTTKAHGIGIGLSISRSIIESLGGRLWADSQPGEGAAFHFSLPLAERASA